MASADRRRRSRSGRLLDALLWGAASGAASGPVLGDAVDGVGAGSGAAIGGALADAHGVVSALSVMIESSDGPFGVLVS